MKQAKEKYSIQAVDNSLDVLEQFFGEKGELGITEISRNLGLHKNNVFRLLATLEHRGYIEQNKNNEHYKLGIKALELGKAFLSHTGLIRVAQDRIVELSNLVNETTYLAILRDNQVFYIEDHESSQPLRVSSRIGTRMSPLCTAIGKIILANYDEDDRDRVIAANQFVKHTENSLSSVADYLEELEQARERGFAVDNEERDLGIRCVAGPIFNYNDQIVAGISLSGPVSRMSDERLEKVYIPAVLDACRDVSRAIGYTGKIP